jgi:hypothetical protein
MPAERDHLTGEEIVLLIEALDALIPSVRTTPMRRARKNERAGRRTAASAAA